LGRFDQAEPGGTKPGDTLFASCVPPAFGRFNQAEPGGTEPGDTKPGDTLFAPGGGFPPEPQLFC